MIQLDGICFVIPMPTKVNIDEQKRLHSENSPVVEWVDGYKVYAWHGTIVPEQWIMETDSITKEDFISEKNVEKRRCLQEILGNDRIMKLLDVELIDSAKETTTSGDGELITKSISLFKTKESDSLTKECMYFLNVTDPSTDREYYLGIPEMKTVWEAKDWTFNNQKIEIRHGDVGLKNVNKKHIIPLFES
jgi:hypothetical protein